MTIENWINPNKPAFLAERFSETKSCANCGSVFITDTECDSCGFQFRFDPLGDPLGEKSFFSIKEIYLHESRSIFFDKKKATKNYHNRLLRRFEILHLFFLSKRMESDLYKGFYFAEFVFLIQELVNIGFKEMVTEQLQLLNDVELKEYLISQAINSINLSWFQRLNHSKVVRGCIVSLVFVLIILACLALYPLAI